MTVSTCDPRHAGVQAAAIALPMIGPALVADSFEWVSVHTGGGNFAWSADTFDGAARVLIVDDDGGLGDDKSESFSAHLDSEANPGEWSATGATMAEAVQLAGMIQAARAFALGFRADAGAPVHEGFRVEFPDFPASDFPAIPAGWTDASWRNDVCPSLYTHNNLQVFVECAEPANREFPECARYSVNLLDQYGFDGDDGVFASEDWQAVLDFVASFVTPAPTGDQLDALAAMATERGGARFEEAMSKALEIYCKAEGLPLMSANELLCELRGYDPQAANPAHVSYLVAFCAQWETVARVTDDQNRTKAEAPAPVAPVILPQAGNLDALTAELNAYAAEHGLEPASADEMAAECRAKSAEYRAHAEWLDDFVDRWNEEEDRLDAERRATERAVWSDNFASQPDAVSRLAAAFRDVLQEWIGTVGMAKVRRANRAYETQGKGGVCASHDHCDANMAMDEAMRRTFGAGPLDGPQEHMTDAALTLWCDAWDKAKADYLTDAV